MGNSLKQVGPIFIGDYLVGAHVVDSWLVTLVLARIGNGTGICEVHVESAPGPVDEQEWMTAAAARFGRLNETAPPAKALTVMALRGLPLAELAEGHWHRHRQAMHAGGRGHPFLDMVAALGNQAAGHGGVNSDHLNALTAARYVELVQSGHRRPLHQLSKEFKLTVAGVRRRLTQAREAGYLTPARKGVAGGELTEVGRNKLSVGSRAEGGEGG